MAHLLHQGHTSKSVWPNIQMYESRGTGILIEATRNTLPAHIKAVSFETNAFWLFFDSILLNFRWLAAAFGVSCNDILIIAVLSYFSEKDSLSAWSWLFWYWRVTDTWFSRHTCSGVSFVKVTHFWGFSKNLYHLAYYLLKSASFRVSLIA